MLVFIDDFQFDFSVFIEMYKQLILSAMLQLWWKCLPMQCVCVSRGYTTQLW